MTDYAAHARSILAGTTYMVLATADADGAPWATPVWFAADGLDRFYWVSWPGARHSLLIAARAEIALTVFDSTVEPNKGTAFYATAAAHMCTGTELGDGLTIYNRRCAAQGIPPFTPERLTGDARLRLYVAEITEAWILDPDATVDQRAAVPQ